MKKIIGLLVLVIACALLMGCTQPAAPTVPATTVPTTEVTTVPTTEVTTVLTTEVTTVPATIAIATEPATPQPTATNVVSVNIIHIRNNTFVPSATTVLPGTGITWINDDKVVHSVKITGKFNSLDIAPTAQYSYTFGDMAGTYTYFDGYYPNSTGTVIVQKGPSIVGAPTLQIVKTA